MKSKLQQSVLQLYRDFLKFGKRFGDPVKIKGYRDKIKEQFEEDKQISRKKFNSIEYKLRSGKNLLKSMEEGQVTGISNVKF